jgi:zinc transport system ATP-binding protein
VDTIVQIEQLDFGYRRQLVLQGIDLPVERGTTLGLIGPNGGGKTTLIKLLLGLLQPSRGSIRIDEMSPLQAARRGDVLGYLPQNPQINDRFPITVREVARLGLAGKTPMFRSTGREDLRFVEELLDRVGMRDVANEPVGELSGGQLQRALFARALAPRPRLLLLDEPTTGIDRAGQQRFIEFIQDLKRDLNLTVVFVSHDLRAVTAICDRIACLNLTLHYHDIPQRIPAELVYSMFSCDLQAMGLGGEAHPCSHEVKSESRISIPARRDETISNIQ